MRSTSDFLRPRISRVPVLRERSAGFTRKRPRCERHTLWWRRCSPAALAWIFPWLFAPPGAAHADESARARESVVSPTERVERSATYARLLSQVEWSPTAEGIPAHPRREGRYFEPGVVYRGVPYSNGGDEGRYIGFDIFLKTFLAAAENPESILYTRDLRGQRRNSAGYYGVVCSAFTSYALQTGTMLPSRAHIAPFREGVERVEPQSAQSAAVGDIVWMSGHVEVVTAVERDAGGRVVLVRVEDSTPPTTRTRDLDPETFEAYLASREASLHRITDFDAWRSAGWAPGLLFPDYAEDSATPSINRVLLLDRGDWVPYRLGEPVQFNVMDRDGEGVRSLVIRREGEVVETIPLDGPGIIERIFDDCGDYTASCLMADGSTSQACEFSVCGLESHPPREQVPAGEDWKVDFAAENMRVILVRIEGGGVRDESYASPRIVWLTDEDRRRGDVRIPGETITERSKVAFSVEGEHRYGRLRNRHEIAVAE